MFRSSRLLTAVSVAALVLGGISTPAYAAGTIISPAYLPLPAGASWGHPFAVNNAAVIVGASGGWAGHDEGIYRDSCSIRAVRWTNRVPTMLDTPAGTWSAAYAESNLGTAVGVDATLTDAPGGDCPTVTRRAAAWDSAGHLALLAPAYSGETVATGVNDIGEVVGVAVPSDAPPNTGYAVRFAGGDVLPLGASPLPVPIDGEQLTGFMEYPPAPHLTNLPSGNRAAGISVPGTFAGTQGYLAVVDAGASQPAGTVTPLYGSTGAGIAAVTGISAGGVVVAGYDANLTGAWWQRWYRSGHPTYHAYPAPVLPPGHGTLMPFAVSPSGTYLTGMGAYFDIGMGFAYSVTGSTAMVDPSVNGVLSGVNDDGLVIGEDTAERPATWQFAG